MCSGGVGRARRGFGVWGCRIALETIVGAPGPSYGLADEKRAGIPALFVIGAYSRRIISCTDLARQYGMTARATAIAAPDASCGALVDVLNMSHIAQMAAMLPRNASTYKIRTMFSSLLLPWRGRIPKQIIYSPIDQLGDATRCASVNRFPLEQPHY